MDEKWKKYHISLDKWLNNQLKINQRPFKNDYDEYRKYIAHYYAEKTYREEMSKIDNGNAQQLNHSQSNNMILPQPILYTIPHPLRRISAELIDSILMLIIKLLLVFILQRTPIISDYINGLSFETFSRLLSRNSINFAEVTRDMLAYKINDENELYIERMLLKFLKTISLDNKDYNFFIFVEVMCRFIRYILEWVLLSRNFLHADQGGATPGKWFMNLKVISCNLIMTQGSYVEVHPGENLGFFRSFVRTQLKELGYFTVLYFIIMFVDKHYRPPHDIIAGTVVVQRITSESSNEQVNPNNHNENG